MKKSLSFFLCVLIIAFLVFSPEMISGGIGKNIYRIREAKQEEAFRGTIRFWHVVSFKTPSGSGYDYLKQRCDLFERNTPYVFIDLKGMTAEEAKRRMNEGERPDIISYPAGMFDESEMILLEKPKNMIESLASVSEKSVPYMMDHYVIAMNRSLMREIGVQQGFGGILSAEMFSDAYEKLSIAGKLPISATETVGLDTQDILNGLVLESDDSYMTDSVMPSVIKTVTGGDVFLCEESGMHLCLSSEYAQMKKDGMEFETEAYAVSDSTDAIQLIGVFDSGDERKNEMLTRLAEGYFTENMQRKLEKISMLPCVAIGEIYESDAERQEIYRRICEKGVKNK